MRVRWIHGSAVLLVVAFAACVPLPGVRIDASRADVELLAGSWKGEYSSPALGRRGMVEFKLSASNGTASGAVSMVPQNATQPYGPSTLAHSTESSTFSSQMLSIRFVSAATGEISGMLEPYWDPDRNCEATTVFRGRLNHDRITGTFSTTFDCGGGEATGDWNVTRKALSDAHR